MAQAAWEIFQDYGNDSSCGNTRTQCGIDKDMIQKKVCNMESYIYEYMSYKYQDVLICLNNKSCNFWMILPDKSLL